MKRLLLGLLSLTVLLIPSLAAAAVPGVIPIQGILTDDAGTPLDANVAVTFTLYDASDAQLFQETKSVTPEAGFFSVQLGDGALPLDLTIFRDNANVELGIQVGADPEMTPRLAFGSVPYAVNAEYASNADNAAMVEGNALSDLDARYVEPGEADSVNSAMIGDGQVTRQDVSGAVPLYEVTALHCEEEPGTLMTKGSCRARQDNVGSCSNSCSAGQVRVRTCDGSCGCASLFFCIVGQPCNPRASWPLCSNNPIAAYGLAP